MTNPNAILVTKDEGDGEDGEVVLRHREDGRTCRLPMSRETTLVLIGLLSQAVGLKPNDVTLNDPAGEQLMQAYDLDAPTPEH